jgi:hypothetical protein
MNNLATKKYLELQQEINTQMLDLLTALSIHRSKQELDPLNWGNVGDLVEVQETLKQLAYFINQNK